MLGHIIVDFCTILIFAHTITIDHNFDLFHLALLFEHICDDLDHLVRVKILQEPLVEAFLDLVQIKQVVDKVEQQLRLEEDHRDKPIAKRGVAPILHLSLQIKRILHDAANWLTHFVADVRCLLALSIVMSAFVLVKPFQVREGQLDVTAF